MENEAEIKIIRTSSGKITAVSVLMPVWSKQCGEGHLNIKIPLLRIDTVALDDNDAEKAIEEAIVSFCIVAEKFGRGVEEELIALGWHSMSAEANEPIIGYNLPNRNEVLDDIMRTGENYVNEHLEIAA
jgi:hypothetical protein